ncbi:MAG: hypothetical protein M0Z36_12350 [Thermaerobacter sp.]|nr:hypothetical protein [Thermaerobacter sp.]
MAFEQHLEIGLDFELKERVAHEFIREGRLFGSVPQAALTADEVAELTRAGWTKRDYHDAPVMEAPQSTIDWPILQQKHRDSTLHAISHRLEQGAPWVGTRQQILEELLASQWEEQEDELRTLLHAFAFASIWDQDEGAADGKAIESRETFFFYTQKMRATALKASSYATQAPQGDNGFWDMVSALSDVHE